MATPPPTTRKRPALIERAIEAVSPRWALERAAYRTALNSYKGGVPTRTSEAYERTLGNRFGTESERFNVLGARDRAYQAYDNNPIARTLVQTETDHVIGDGLNFQPTSKSVAWNKEAEDRYYAWLDECSVRGADAEPGCEIQRSLWSYSRVAGDIGWVLVARGPESRVQIVRAENIATPDGMFTDRAVYDGIRFDEFGRPVTFYVLAADSRFARRDFTAIPARDFVWLPHMTKPGQARPPSCYVTIFDLMAHLDRYVDGVSLAAWMATVFGIVFKQNNAAKQHGLLQSTLSDSQGVQRKAVTFENGMVKYVGTDEEVAQVQATQPMQQTPEFIRTMFRMLGQPFDMPLEVLAKDMSQCNFASARIGLLPFYRTCRVKAERFGARWSRTIRWWLSRERLRAPDDPKRWRTAFPEDFWRHELLLNAFDYTDPVSEAQSDLLQIDMGTKSPQMVIAERGRNAEKLLRERREWAAMSEDLPPQVRSTMTRDAVPEPAEAPAGTTTDGQESDNATQEQEQAGGNGNGRYAAAGRLVHHPRGEGSQ